MRIVVREWERVLRYRNGQFAELLQPGVSRRGRWRAQYVRVDLRPRLLPVPGQEVLTSDAVTVRISLLARCRISEPRQWHEAAASPDDFAYAALQVALRDVVAARSLDALVAARASIGSELRSACADAVAAVGLALDDVAVRDLMLPSELRRSATEAATARAEGLARLERARSEVAATRALANAARLVADNPTLLQLRMLQAIEAGGATVILSVDGAAVPITAPARR